MTAFGRPVVLKTGMSELRDRKFAVHVVIDEDDMTMEIKVAAEDTFIDLIELILSNRKNLRGSYHWSISFAYRSNVRVRSIYLPAQDARVVDTVRAEESGFPGNLILVMVSFVSPSSMFASPLQNNRDSRVYSRIRKDQLKLQQTIPNSMELVLSTADVDRFFGVNNVAKSNTSFAPDVEAPELVLASAQSVPVSTASRVPIKAETCSQRMLYDLLNRSIKHGPLVRKHPSGEEEFWYGILDPNRLWFYITGGSHAALHSIRKHPDNVHLSYIDLPQNMALHDKGPGHVAFDLTNFGDIFLNNPLENVHLKGKDEKDKEDWIAAFEDRLQGWSDAILPSENDVFHNADHSIAQAQYERSLKDVDTLAKKVSFEGMLGSRSLREHFKAFLEAHQVPESFMFWEQVEDYKRGHEQACDKFPFFGGVSYSPTETLQWAQRIFDTFLQNGAPHQISDCSGEMAAAIQAKLHAAKSSIADGRSFPPANLFDKVQAISYQKLKFSEGHYSAFVSIPAYRAALKAAVNADERYKSGLRPMATCLADNRIKPSDFGHVGEDVDGSFVTETAATGGVLSRVFGWRKRPTNTASDHKEAEIAHNLAGGAAFARVVRNVHWRKEIIRLGLFLPQWWWLFIDIEPDSTEQSGAPTAAGFLAYYRNDLSKLMDLRIAAAHATKATRSFALNPPLGLKMYSSHVGHPTLWRLMTVEQCTSAFVCAGQPQPRGLYGHVLLAGILRCHHVVTSMEEGTSLFRGNSGTRSSPKKGMRRASYVPSAAGAHLHDESAASSAALSAVTKMPFVTQHAMVTTFQNRGFLFLMDDSSAVVVSRLRLDLVTQIGISSRILNGVELYEGLGEDKRCLLVFVAQALIQDEACRVAQRWVDHMAPFCHPDCRVTNILHYGMMQKRGVTNSAFQPRFFVLTSALSLAYYRVAAGKQSEDSVGSTYKGEINLMGVQEGDVQKQDAWHTPDTHGAKATWYEFSIQLPDRLFHLQVAGFAEAELWCDKIVRAIADFRECSWHNSFRYSIGASPPQLKTASAVTQARPQSTRLNPISLSSYLELDIDDEDEDDENEDDENDEAQALPTGGSRQGQAASDTKELEVADFLSDTDDDEEEEDEEDMIPQTAGEFGDIIPVADTNRRSSFHAKNTVFVQRNVDA